MSRKADGTWRQTLAYIHRIGVVATVEEAGAHELVVTIHTEDGATTRTVDTAPTIAPKVRKAA